MIYYISTRKKLARLVEARAVLLLRYPAEARRGAGADHIRDAVPMVVLAGAVRLAFAYPVALLDEVLRCAHYRARGEGSEIPRPVVLHGAHAREARPRRGAFAAQREVALVVAHQDVEVRLVALYERRLGEQRLGVVLDGHPLEVVDGVDHRAHLRGVVRARAEIRGHAAAEVLRLADVNYHAPAISHEIAARAVGHVLETLSDEFGDQSAD